MYAVKPYVRGQATTARACTTAVQCATQQAARTAKGALATPALSGVHMLIAAHDPSATAQHRTVLTGKDLLFHLRLWQGTISHRMQAEQNTPGSAVV